MKESQDQGWNEDIYPLLFMVGSIVFVLITVAVRYATGSWISTIAIDITLAGCVIGVWFRDAMVKSLHGSEKSLLKILIITIIVGGGTAGLLYATGSWVATLFFGGVIAVPVLAIWFQDTITKFLYSMGLSRRFIEKQVGLSCDSIEPKKEGIKKDVIPCPDCNSNVSKRATSCPNCGCPIEGSASQSKGSRSMNGLIAMIGFVLVSCIVFVVIVGITDDQLSDSHYESDSVQEVTRGSDSSTEKGNFEKMELVFKGKHSRREIKNRLTNLMKKFDISITDDNVYECGNNLHVARKKTDVSEMKILSCMDAEGVSKWVRDENTPMKAFRKAAANCAVMIKRNRKY